MIQKVTISTKLSERLALFMIVTFDEYQEFLLPGARLLTHVSITAW